MPDEVSARPDAAEVLAAVVIAQDVKRRFPHNPDVVCGHEGSAVLAALRAAAGSDAFTVSAAGTLEPWQPAALPDGRVLSEEEACEVSRPGGAQPWSWSAPINVLVSDSHKWGTEWRQTLAICEDGLTRLYAAGYRLVAPPVPAVTDVEPQGGEA